MINNIISLVIILLILIAIIGMISTILGFIRLPDEITKIHAAGVTGSFAVELILIAGFIYYYKFLNTFEYKFIVAIIFIFLTAPISAHFISICTIIFNKTVYSKNKTNEAEKVLKDIEKFNK